MILLNESHTAVAMAAAIATRLENHMPKDSTLVCTVTDNAANVVKMAAILHTDFDQVQIEAIPNSWTEAVRAARRVRTHLTLTCVFVDK